MAVSVMWFRRDLRLDDHPALAAASTCGSVAGLFVADEKLLAASGVPRKRYLCDTVAALHSESGGLSTRTGDPVIEVADFASRVGATRVFVSDDFGPYGRSRDALVRRALTERRIELVLVGSPYAVSPGTVLSGTGGPYKVFTPFRRAWAATEWEAAQTAVPVDWVSPIEQPCDDVVSQMTASQDLVSGADLGTNVFDRVTNRLSDFLTHQVHGYGESRNIPALDATSRLSAALRFGLIHPRQILARLGDSPGDESFRSELAWREFYADMLWHHPNTARESMNPAMRKFPVDTDDLARVRYSAWCSGQTGFPLVDAGMRQLLEEGWMHNRLRMIVASFLVKDLHLPWQWGARHFMNHLVDGDLASNSHGWQWVAGTGTDAAPYFRIFNPTTQSERWDPQGDFIRRYVPELQRLSAATIHSPSAKGRGVPLGYANPIVDHNTERIESLRRYALVRSENLS